MARLTRPRWIWVASLAVVLVVAAGLWGLLGSSVATHGDPGGEVMAQLTPTVTSLPGYGTAALPWVSELPQSLDASYAIKIEPFQDSCDGMAGTQGWSQVVVQSRFQWNKGLPALVAFMEPRLAKLGWSIVPQRRLSNPTNQSWTKKLSNGTRADLSVSPEGGGTPPVWQLDALGDPIGKAASGC